jgi:CHAT domain-containing protein
MCRTGRWMITMLIVCGLLSMLPRAVTAQNPSSQAMEDYRRGAEALQLTFRAEELYRAGRYEEAIPLAERAVALYSGSYSGSDIKHSPLNVLAKLYRAKGDYARAEATILRLLKIVESSPSGNFNSFQELSLSIVLNELAALYEAKGDYVRALQNRLRSSELTERYLAQVLTPNINPSATDPSEVWRNRIAVGVAGTAGAESYRQFMLDSLKEETYATVSLHIRYLPQDKQAAQLALTTILRRKGRVLDTMADQLNILRRYGNSQDQKLVDQLTKAYTRLAALSNENSQTVELSPSKRMEELGKEMTRAMEQGAPTQEIEKEMRKEAEKFASRITSNITPNLNQIMQIQMEVNHLEEAISWRSAELRKPETAITLSAVCQAIPADAALVEIIEYQPFNAKARTEAESFGGPRYAAYVVRRNEDAPQWVELGDAAGTDDAVLQLRNALRDPQRADVKELARALDERVMRPVRKLLGQTRRIFLAPDGVLNLIPFAALADEKNQYLVENYSINYLTSGRDLLRLQTKGESHDEAKVFANPLFDLMAGKQQSGSNKQSLATTNPTVANPISKDLKAVNYSPLPGTAVEAFALGKLFPKATVYTEANATEAALKSVNRPRLLHIATHGFFLDDQTATQSLESPRMDTGINTIARSYFTLLRSGLILAGVRQRASGSDEDGVLTALEMAGMDLWGTKLVVLSACETGLGLVKIGEGVYGLRRALVLAGSETQIMSLWKVSDAGTRDLMVAYYARLQQGESRIEAMRQVQLAMLRGELLPGSGNKQLNLRDTGEADDAVPAKEYRHPYFWAAFIPSGDWRNMEGKEAQSQ